MNLNEILQNVLAENDSAFFYTPPTDKKNKSYFFLSPVEVVETFNPDEITKEFKKIDKLIGKGLFGYGYISYETGYLFEEKLKILFNKYEIPLFRFCFFREKDVQVFKSKDLKIDKWTEDSFDICSFNINTSKEQYIESVNKIKNFIADGDTYQVNYTIKDKFDFFGSPASLFKKLIFNQSAKYSAMINSGEDLIISLSPELFFKTKEDSILTKPMKGTLKRGYKPDDDDAHLQSLKKSEKNKAENLMIVDLLRNDFGKISREGSVKVNSFFEIEKYESLFQKVSTVEAKLKKQMLFSSIIKNTFPSGSITGAPKIRTMEIIHQLENEPRGIYTGSLGMIKPVKSKTGEHKKSEIIFNVAIRTLTVNKKSGKGEIGIGSGIVWDSNPVKEYEETLLKSEFLLKPFPYFEIFETMLINRGKIFLFDKHIDRMKTAAGYFLFNFDDERIRKIIKKKLKELGSSEKYRMKLILNKWGEITIEIKDFPVNPGKIKVAISSKRISSGDKFRYFKTTNREIYDEEFNGYSEKGFFDVIFLNENDQVCEGAISNIFIRKGSQWITPPENDGLLQGIFRNFLLNKNPGIKQKSIFISDLQSADEIILTNSLRGLVKVEKLLIDPKKEII